MLEQRVETLAERLREIETQMSDPAVIRQTRKYRELAKEHAGISELLSLHEEFNRLSKQIDENISLVHDAGTEAEIRELAEQELKSLDQSRKKLEDEIMLRLLPRDENDARNTIVEIRAGTGGEEAALFVADLYRMYSKYAERMDWKIETMNSHPTGIGGFKEIVFSIAGEDVYRRMKYESGVHRVQRVPATEASGRIHTSAVTCAVFPEAEDIEVEVDGNDLRIDVFRSSGPGGQSVNTTDSAVRITHLPTGIVVTCQDEKSQHKNKTKAMRVLRARLKEAMDVARAKEISTLRRSQISTGDRSAKIRTYNYPQSRVTDHRITLTIHNLSGVMEGDLGDLTSALLAHDREEMLKNQ